MTVTATKIEVSSGTATVTWSDGTVTEGPATATITLADAPPIVWRAPMLIGSDRLPGPNVTLYPRNHYFRLYSPPGAGIKTLPTVYGLLYQVSFKDRPTAALVDGWLKTLPTRTALAVPNWMRPFDVLAEYNHEPEGDMTSTAYTSGVDVLKTRLGVWNAAHPNGPTVGLAQTFTGYAQVHGKNMTDGVPATIANLWRGADILGVDVEKDTTKFPTGRPDHEKLMGWIRDKAAALKVPYVIPEFGWMPPNDQELADWYTHGLAWLRTNGCAAVGVYDTAGSTANYVLDGPPLAAVQAAIAGQ